MNSSHSFWTPVEQDTPHKRFVYIHYETENFVTFMSWDRSSTTGIVANILFRQHFESRYRLAFPEEVPDDWGTPTLRKPKAKNVRKFSGFSKFIQRIEKVS